MFQKPDMPQPDMTPAGEEAFGEQPDLSLEMLEKPKKKNQDQLRWIRSLALGVTAGAIYGLLTRLAVGSTSLMSTMTNSFLLFVPVALGALTVFFTPRGFRASYRHALVAPWLTAFVFLLVVALLVLETVICLVICSPLFLGMSSLGGVLMCWTLRQIDQMRMGTKSKHYLLALLMIMPYLAGPLEKQVPAQDSIRTVETQITIDASREAIWRNIIRVPPISPQEQHFSISHLFGVPRPVQAMLSYEGVGGLRHASYDDGLVFLEKITDWDYLNAFRFTIQRDPGSAPEAPFDQIGGQYFDVLDATYRLEPADGHIILHLVSHERLTTHFNGYGGWWTDFIMSDLQSYILEIVKARAEGGEATRP